MRINKNVRVVEFIGVIVALSMLLLSPVSSAQTRSVVVLFGDSITVGFNSGRRVDIAGGSTTLSGPRQFLSDLLNNPDEPRFTTVANWGFGGSSSTNGAGRISRNLAFTRNSVSADRYFVMIMYGTNDFGRGISEGTTAFNNGVMVRSARSSGYIPIVGTVTPRSDRSIFSLASRIASTAALNNAQVVNQFAFFNARPLSQNFELERSLLTGQFIRLHPNDNGYRLLVRNWFDGALRSRIPVFVAPPPPPPPPPVIAPIIQLLLDD